MPRFYSPTLWLRLLGMLLLFLGLYQLVVLPWTARWGATDAEVAAAMPGDELVAAPGLRVTRAITLDAVPEKVWPWLLQIGTGRAGWYSYDCLDNGCRPSAESILPAYQGLKLGDKMPISPDGKTAFDVKIFKKNALLGLGAGDEHIHAFWALQLNPLPEGKTRLVVRLRMAVQPAWLGWPLCSALRPAHFIMERKMLLELKRRLSAPAA